MGVNVIVVAVTLMMSGFVAVWLACPRSRLWFEAPKTQPLWWEERDANVIERSNRVDQANKNEQIRVRSILKFGKSSD